MFLILATECRYTELGTEYRGIRKTTESGRTCQRWDSQSPHTHSQTGEQLVENYCRNPDNTPGGPWCFTTDINKRWESCRIAMCGEYYRTSKLWNNLGNTITGPSLILISQYVVLEMYQITILYSLSYEFTP